MEQPRRSRVLVGVTGSVAAVKSPLVALKISRELNADVIILLTRAGKTFWTKAPTYDPITWEEFEKRKKLSDKEGSLFSDKIAVHGMI